MRSLPWLLGGIMLVNGDYMVNRRIQEDNVTSTDAPSATPSSIPSSVPSQSSNKSGFPSQIPSDSPSSSVLECGGRAGESCREDKDCCSQSCRSLPGRRVGKCRSVAELSKERLGAGRGGASGREQDSSPK